MLNSWISPRPPSTRFCAALRFFFPNLRAALAQFLRVLKPGGRLAVSTWGRDDERWAWLGDLRQKYSPAFMRESASARPAFNQPEAMQAMLREGGLTQVQAIEDEQEFMYADEDEWLAVQWSHGMRYILESAQPDVRDQLRAEAFAHLKASGSAGHPHRLALAIRWV